MAPHSSTLAWKIPWAEEPGSLQSMGSLRVRLDFHFSLSCIGEGNGNPLQCSCLENPRDGGAWWAAISGVIQSQTWLKRLSSSSSSSSSMLVTWCCFSFMPLFYFQGLEFWKVHFPHFLSARFLFKLYWWEACIWDLGVREKPTQNFKEKFCVLGVTCFFAVGSWDHQCCLSATPTQPVIPHGF